MTFHVTPSGRSFSKILCISSSSDDSDDDDDDDDSEDDDDDNSKNILSKEKSRLKAESSSSENSCFLAPTPSNLRQDRVSLTKRFSRTNALNKRWCVIDLMNQRGKSWALGLRHNKVTGQDYILGGWRSFCRANELKTGIFYRFELVRNGARPLLQLCSDITSQGNCSKANRKAKVSAKSSREDESASLTVTLKPYMLKSRQLRLSSDFSRKNGIKKEGEITLVDKNGVKWPSYVVCVQGRLYITKGVIDFWAANQIETGETFTLELVRGEGTTPMLKFCSKAKVSRDEEEVQEETETRFQKRARVSSEGGPSRCTQASNKSTAAPKNLECKQPLQPCSFSDQLTKVKQCSVGIITDVRRFRSELEIKEQNLEALLQELSALGEKVLEINKIIK
ncbi:B3 domain-containing protein REM3 isoform X1 [Eutrema salsugineum]|uniref:B3 domain-containing protein REM3 isoform X1 n=1 Tax=Eutrema salsugineum TaxID=72664 RepID=UPI000CED541A|nr:B3 domain-containing protein REM3 isoform X1 [Eutrema salsugineum]